MKNRLLHIFFLALAALFCLCSCGLEEPTNTPQNSDGYVEFVARPTAYNKHDVATKADGPDPIEDIAYNAFLLIFNESGQRILFREVIGAGSTTSPSTSIPMEKGLSQVTACYLINVPHSFAKGIVNLEMPEDATQEFKAANYNSYLNTAVLEGIKYKPGTPMGIPLIDVDNDATTADVPCIPMFGRDLVDLSNQSRSIAIPISRLFAKVTVNLTMNLNLDGWTQELVQTGTYYQLNSYTLYNLPNKVKLTPTTDKNSAWIKDYNSFEYIGTAEKPGNGAEVKTKIYNNKYVSSTEIEFFFYAPEYFLDSGRTDGNQKLKPTYSPSDAFPIYLTLNGTYCQYSVTSAQMVHKVYFGRNEKYDFTLERNKNYINTLTIAGTECNKDGEGDYLDYRVSTEYINNPVAESGQSANCYVIGKTGDYSFPAYKGAYNDLTEAVLCNNATASTLEVIANDNSSNIQLSKLSYDPNRNIVSFTIDKIDDGNVVIALKNKDTSTEWSWHLWCTTQSVVDVLGWGSLKTQPYPNGDLMDRNLGANPTSSQFATPGLATGLYYKYGCKDPYLAGSYKGGGALYDANGEEIVSTWSATKSPTDPCPPGYKVPNTSAWQNADSNKSTELGGFLLYRSGTTSAYYPYSNYLLASGGLNENFIGSVPFSEGYSFGTTTVDGTLQKKLLFKTYDFPRLRQNTYTMTDMDIQTSKEEGRLWCNDGYICYDHNTLDVSAVFSGGVDALRSKLIINQYTQQKRYAVDYSISIKDAGKVIEQLLAGKLQNAFLESIADWGNPEEVNPPNMSDGDRDDLLSRLILLEMSNINQTDYRAITSSFNKDEGYQIRCVVDTQ